MMPVSGPAIRAPVLGARHATDHALDAARKEQDALPESSAPQVLDCEHLASRIMQHLLGAPWVSRSDRAALAPARLTNLGLARASRTTLGVGALALQNLCRRLPEAELVEALRGMRSAIRGLAAQTRVEVLQARNLRLETLTALSQLLEGTRAQLIVHYDDPGKLARLQDVPEHVAELFKQHIAVHFEAKPAPAPPMGDRVEALNLLPGIERVELRGQMIREGELLKLPEGVKSVVLDYNQITGGLKLPDSTECVSIHANELADLRALGRGTRLRRLIASRNRLRTVAGQLPEGLEVLSLGSNSIADLSPGHLPSTLKSLDLSRTGLAGPLDLRSIGLEWLNLAFNRIEHLSGIHLPETLERLDISGNPLGGTLDLTGLGAGLARLSLDHLGRAEAIHGALPSGLVRLSVRFCKCMRRVEITKSAEKLEYLTLEGSTIQQVTLPKMPALKTVNVVNCPVREWGWLQALPAGATVEISGAMPLELLRQPPPNLTIRLSYQRYEHPGDAGREQAAGIRLM